MTSQDDDFAGLSPSQKLAELVARRKAAAGGGPKGVPGQKQSERRAAAFSASRSKPAMSK